VLYRETETGERRESSMETIGVFVASPSLTVETRSWRAM
jgi:hypothetical protein